MSKLPTLFAKGNLVPGMGESQDELNKWVPIEFLVNWFDQRIPKIYKQTPKINNPTISDRIIILQSGTGSSKSTGLPPTLYLRFFNRYRKSILVTQPAVLTTIEIPKTIASIPFYTSKNKEGLQIELYKNLGYQTGEFIRKPIERGIVFTTVGILLQFLKVMTFEQIRKKYKFIIIDECHARSIELDIVMSLLKKLVNDNISEAPFCIFMSATFNVEKYANYFNTKTIFKVSGKSYQKIENYLEVSSSNYIQGVLDIVKKVHNTEEIEQGDINDILIFVSGAGAMNKIIKGLNDLNQSFDNPIIPIPLNSQIFKSGDNNYVNLFTKLHNLKVDKNGKLYKPSRRVIVSTNIAETGVTIESLKYCIDTGFVTAIEFNPNFNCSILLNKPVTQSMAIQRKGRIGRVRPGIYYGMFTKSTYDDLIVDTIPAIMTEESILTILNIIVKVTIETIEDYKDKDLSKLDKFDLSLLDLMDPISIDSMNNSIQKLYILGMIHKNLYPTQIGIISVKFRKLSVENIKMILSGYHHKVNILDLITIAIFLTIGKQK